MNKPRKLEKNKDTRYNKNSNSFTVFIMKPKLSQKDVQHIADLAKIELTDSEKEKYANELSAVLGFIEQLSEADTANIAPNSQVAGLVNVTREDAVENCNLETRKKILGAAPMRKGDYIKVKAIL